MSTLKDQSPDHESSSPSTAVTTPEHEHDDDDIWASDEHDGDLSSTHPHRHELLSDLPAIRRQHMTDGYREGLSVGKAKVMQRSFDDGYPIGVQIALRAGKVLGILEGYLASKSTSLSPQNRASLQKIYDSAREELSCPALLKNIGDDVIVEASQIPASIDEVISRWERMVLGAAK